MIKKQKISLFSFRCDIGCPYSQQSSRKGSLAGGPLIQMSNHGSRKGSVVITGRSRKTSVVGEGMGITQPMVHRRSSALVEESDGSSTLLPPQEEGDKENGDSAFHPDRRKGCPGSRKGSKSTPPRSRAVSLELSNQDLSLA